ncbi:MAG TPA: SMC-Scp complex subunit ScpB, partial [Ottowia sp.]|nr:SMC-Scp complex subunit ScpB [Ottowia sp.]
YATTRQFLDDLGLQSLDQLPVLEDAAEPVPGMFEALAGEETPAPAAGQAEDAEGAAPSPEPEPAPEDEAAAPTANADTAPAVAAEDDTEESPTP